MTNFVQFSARALLLQVILFALSYLPHHLGTVTNSPLLYLPLVLGIVSYGASSSGSGLGLYIAREAIQKQGGTITMHSTWGEGSTFSIRLPIR